MTKGAFLRLLEKTLELDEGRLTGDETLSDIDWDSLGVVTFLALADEEFSVQLSAKSVSACKTVGDLIALLKSHVE